MVEKVGNADLCTHWLLQCDFHRFCKYRTCHFSELDLLKKGRVLKCFPDLSGSVLRNSHWALLSSTVPVPCLLCVFLSNAFWQISRHTLRIEFHALINHFRESILWNDILIKKLKPATLLLHIFTSITMASFSEIYRSIFHQTSHITFYTCSANLW